MEKENRLKNGLDVLYLAACALHDAVPDQKRMFEMDTVGVMKAAARHSMLGVTYLGIKKYLDCTPNAGNIIDAETLAKWKSGYAKIIKKTILFDMEREKILSFFDQNGIWYLPLKGIVLQNFYPQLGMRQMADNDILFDENYRAELKKYMLENGYEGGEYVGRTDAGCHDTYLKAPVYNFEMHHNLHPATEKSVLLRNYYDHIKDRLIKDDGNRCGYHMSDEDFYIYITTHAYRHYIHAGNGIRSFMDVYVYMSKKQDCLNFDYIENEISKLGMADFEKMMRTLAFKLFSEPNHKNMLKFTASEAEFLSFHIGSGTYGTVGNAMDIKLSEISQSGKITFGVKFKYFMRRLIPGNDCYMLRYPLAYKYKVLIPFVVIARFVQAVCTKPLKLLGEIKALTRKKS